MVYITLKKFEPTFSSVVGFYIFYWALISKMFFICKSNRLFWCGEFEACNFFMKDPVQVYLYIHTHTNLTKTIVAKFVLYSAIFVRVVKCIHYVGKCFPNFDQDDSFPRKLSLVFNFHKLFLDIVKKLFIFLFTNSLKLILKRFHSFLDWKVVITWT